VHIKLLKKLGFFIILCFAVMTLIADEVYAQSSSENSKKFNSNKISSQIKAKNGALTISQIEVIGQKKIEKDAILARIKSRVGEEFSEAKIAEDIRSLFKMGFFVQIEVFRSEDENQVALEFKVIEKPTVTEIVFEGNTELKAEDLLEQTTLKQWEILNYDKVKESILKLEKLYEDKGFYLVKIEPEIEPVIQDETVILKFKITENEKVKVKQITFIGNKELKENFLKDRLFTQEAGFFSGMSSSGSFKQEAFEADLQILKRKYWNLGYLQVKIDRPIVTVTPDKKSIYITYYIEEGEQYSVGEVDFAGDIIFDKSELLSAVKIKDNGIFSVEVMQKDILDLQAKFGDLGYAFANVIPRYGFEEKEKKVNLIFEFEKGNKVFFGEINVVNNSKTRDKVVRRELKIREGELYNETRKRLSQENVQRLGFFEEVNFKQIPTPENPDLYKIDIVIKERNTGQLQLTAGYGNVQGLSLGGSVQQNNFRGLGQTLGARIEATKNRQDYSISLTEPYFLDSKWSAGFNLFYIENKERINYDNRNTGIALRFGHPVYGDDIRAYIRYSIDKSDLFANQFTDPVLFPLETARGVTSSLTGTLEYDTRNDRFSPSKGILADASYEYAGLGGDLKYGIFRTQFRYFKNLFWDVVWRNNVSFSSLSSLEGNEVPFTKREPLGGAYTLRGFGYSTVGKRIFSQNRYDQIGTNNGNPFYSPGISDEERRRRSTLIFGGTKNLYYQAEMQYPMIKEAGLNGVFFYDIGQSEDVIDSSKFVSDFGLGFRWMSPLGLLRFEWGWPLTTDDVDRDAVNFEFSIGPPF
jgi:outer membrane protein insertion porin family